MQVKNNKGSIEKIKIIIPKYHLAFKIITLHYFMMKLFFLIHMLIILEFKVILCFPIKKIPEGYFGLTQIYLKLHII